MATEEAALTASPPAYRDGNVVRWLTAYTASLVGDSVYFVALAWSAQKAAGPTEVGLIMAAGALPRALLMLGGGVVAAAVALTAPALWLLVAVALVFGAVDALFVPAIGALPARITSSDQLTRV